MNKEDYVSIEVAKLLKEKGFDEYCNTCYYYHDNEWILQDGNNRNRINGKDWMSRPNLYEAQKWIRNNHNIHIVIDNYACGYAWFLYKADNGTRISEYAEDGPNDGGCWDTYEEALNAGIIEALKLI